MRASPASSSASGAGQRLSNGIADGAAVAEPQRPGQAVRRPAMAASPNPCGRHGRAEYQAPLNRRAGRTSPREPRPPRWHWNRDRRSRDYAARRFDRRLLHDDKPGTRQRQRTQVLEMPVVRRTVRGAVLAHRRHRDPIGKGDAAEAKWFEQGRHACHHERTRRFELANRGRRGSSRHVPNPRSSGSRPAHR